MKTYHWDMYHVENIVNDIIIGSSGIFRRSVIRGIKFYVHYFDVEYCRHFVFPRWVIFDVVSYPTLGIFDVKSSLLSLLMFSHLMFSLSTVYTINDSGENSLYLS
jgi:hypothetical protein